MDDKDVLDEFIEIPKGSAKEGTVVAAATKGKTTPLSDTPLSEIAVAKDDTCSPTVVVAKKGETSSPTMAVNKEKTGSPSVAEAKGETRSVTVTVAKDQTCSPTVAVSRKDETSSPTVAVNKEKTGSPSVAEVKNKTPSPPVVVAAAATRDETPDAGVPVAKEKTPSPANTVNEEKIASPAVPVANQKASPPAVALAKDKTPPPAVVVRKNEETRTPAAAAAAAPITVAASPHPRLSTRVPKKKALPDDMIDTSDLTMKQMDALSRESAPSDKGPTGTRVSSRKPKKKALPADMIDPTNVNFNATLLNRTPKPSPPKKSPPSPQVHLKLKMSSNRQLPLAAKRLKIANEQTSIVGQVSTATSSSSGDPSSRSNDSPSKPRPRLTLKLSRPIGSVGNSKSSSPAARNSPAVAPLGKKLQGPSITIPPNLQSAALPPPPSQPRKPAVSVTKTTSSAVDKVATSVSRMKQAPKPKTPPLEPVKQKAVTSPPIPAVKATSSPAKTPQPFHNVANQEKVVKPLATVQKEQNDTPKVATQSSSQSTCTHNAGAPPAPKPANATRQVLSTNMVKMDQSTLKTSTSVPSQNNANGVATKRTSVANVDFIPRSTPKDSSSSSFTPTPVKPAINDILVPVNSYPIWPGNTSLLSFLTKARYTLGGVCPWVKNKLLSQGSRLLTKHTNQLPDGSRIVSWHSMPWSELENVLRPLVGGEIDVTQQVFSPLAVNVPCSDQSKKTPQDQTSVGVKRKSPSSPLHAVGLLTGKRRSKVGVRRRDVTVLSIRDALIHYSTPTYSLSFCRRDPNYLPPVPAISIKKQRRSSGNGKPEKGNSRVVGVRNTETQSASKAGRRISLSGKSSSNKPVSTRKKSAPSPKETNQTTDSLGDASPCAREFRGKGITQRPSGKWQAQAYFGGASRYVGVFESEGEANKAYVAFCEHTKPYRKSDLPKEEMNEVINTGRRLAFQANGMMMGSWVNENVAK